MANLLDGLTKQKKSYNFLIPLLTPEERTEIVRTFPETFRELADEKVISRTWYRKLARGEYAPSDELLLEACGRDPRIVEWIKERVRDRVEALHELMNR